MKILSLALLNQAKKSECGIARPIGWNITEMFSQEKDDPPKEINCVLETSCHMKIILKWEDISCYRKIFTVTGRSVQSQEEISCHRKIFPLAESNFVYRKTSPVTGRNFLSQEEISCHRMKFCLTGRDFHSIYSLFVLEMKLHSFSFQPMT